MRNQTGYSKIKDIQYITRCSSYFRYHSSRSCLQSPLFHQAWMPAFPNTDKSSTGKHLPNNTGLLNITDPHDDVAFFVWTIVTLLVPKESWSASCSALPQVQSLHALFLVEQSAGAAVGGTTRSASSSKSSSSTISSSSSFGLIVHTFCCGTGAVAFFLRSSAPEPIWYCGLEALTTTLNIIASSLESPMSLIVSKSCSVKSCWLNSISTRPASTKSLLRLFLVWNSGVSEI